MNGIILYGIHIVRRYGNSAAVIILTLILSSNRPPLIFREIVIVVNKFENDTSPF